MNNREWGLNLGSYWSAGTIAVYASIALGGEREVNLRSIMIVVHYMTDPTTTIPFFLIELD